MTDTLETTNQNSISPEQEIVAMTPQPDNSPPPAAVHNGKALTSKLFEVPVEIMVSVGKAKISIAELVSIERDRLFKLDTKVEDPVSILVNGKPVAYGYLEEAEDGGFQVRVSTLIGNGAR